jgi:glycosyltransferase involved in cell wall biosynthesis
MAKLLVLISPEGDAMMREVFESVLAARDRHEIFVLAIPSEAGRYADARIAAAKWRPGGIVGMAQSISKLRKTIERFAPDLIHAHGFPAIAAVLGTVPASLAARTIATFHDPQRERLGLAAQGFTVIPHAVSYDLADPRLARPPARPGPIVGWNGRLNADGAWETLIDAFALVRQTHPDARLELAGTGRTRQFVAAHVREKKLADAVTFRGEIAPRELFATIDVLAVPVSRDALPHAPLEALVAGVPVVAANVGALSDMLAPLVTGWLVPDDAPGFRDGILAAWERADEAWAGAAAQRDAARAMYGREVVTAAYEGLYARVRNQRAQNDAPSPSATVAFGS